MKKRIIAITFAVLFALLMLPTAAFADVFVASPSTVPAPTLDGFSSSNADWKGELILTPYSQRSTLPDDLQKMIEDAAASIVNAPDVAALNSGITAIATSKGIKVADLAVSDLFDLRTTIPDYGTATVKLSSDSFKNFVVLLHYNGTAWEIVKDASVSGKTLTFSTDDFSPFAVVVNTKATNPGSPQTGEAFPRAMMAGAILFGTLGVFILVKGRKEKSES